MRTPSISMKKPEQWLHTLGCKYFPLSNIVSDGLDQISLVRHFQLSRVSSANPQFKLQNEDPLPLNSSHNNVLPEFKSPPTGASTLGAQPSLSRSRQWHVNLARLISPLCNAGDATRSPSLAVSPLTLLPAATSIKNSSHKSACSASRKSSQPPRLHFELRSPAALGTAPFVFEVTV